MSLCHVNMSISIVGGKRRICQHVTVKRVYMTICHGKQGATHQTETILIQTRYGKKRGATQTLAIRNIL